MTTGFQLNSVYKALADPTRREILAMLRDQDLSAGELAEHFDISRPAMTKHFQVLLDADLVYRQRKGQQQIYSLNLSVLEEALAQFMSAMGIGRDR